MITYYSDEWVTILHGSCLDLDLKGFTGIVTDPPYELSFMGKKWDGTGVSFQSDTWRVLRESCKPGAIMLSFGGTRTFHRIACAIEDAGWELRDTIMWVYGSGFPKSLDISKSIDKHLGAERDIVSSGKAVKRMIPGADQDKTGSWLKDNGREYIPAVTIPATPEAQLWSGYGTALKPAYEPVLVCMNPCDGTFANNALKHGVAGINIDECRIEAVGYTNGGQNRSIAFGMNGLTDKQARCDGSKGRFPANFIHDGSQEVMDLFPNTKSGKPGIKHTGNNGPAYGAESRPEGSQMGGFGDAGSAARFFYCAKASPAERNMGCGESGIHLSHGNTLRKTENALQNVQGGNHHPTVKPLALMIYLVKLITPPKDALLLDPFMGSGTTLMACKQLGIKCIGIEKDESSCEIAAKRCQSIRR